MNYSLLRLFPVQHQIKPVNVVTKVISLTTRSLFIFLYIAFFCIFGFISGNIHFRKVAVGCTWCNYPIHRGFNNGGELG